MHAESTVTESVNVESAPRPEPAAASEWVTPDFVEQSACAEICAYVFTA